MKRNLCKITLKKQKIKSLTLKAVLLFVISCALLIPLFMLRNLVDERKYNSDNVIAVDRV